MWSLRSFSRGIDIAKLGVVATESENKKLSNFAKRVSSLLLYTAAGSVRYLLSRCMSYWYTILLFVVGACCFTVVILLRWFGPVHTVFYVCALLCVCVNATLVAVVDDVNCRRSSAVLSELVVIVCSTLA